MEAPAPGEGDGGASMGSATGGTAPSGGRAPIEAPIVEPEPTEPRPCPTFDGVMAQGTVTDARLNEVSGLVESRSQSGILWVHNDSGDGPRLFAINGQGEFQAEVSLQDTAAVDWEDMAAGPGPGGEPGFLYVGDFGDNFYERSAIAIHRIEEPRIEGGTGEPSFVSDVETFDFTYPNGPNNAETLLIDPWTGDLYIVAKKDEGDSIIFRASAPLVSGVLENVGSLQFGTEPLVGNALTTGGDISVDGHWIGIRSYSHAFVWVRQEGESVVTALGRAPCTADSISEVQGETMAFAADASGYFTLSEQENQPLNFYATR